METELVTTLMEASMDGILTLRAIIEPTGDTGAAREASETIVDFEVRHANPAAVLAEPLLADVVGRRLLEVLPVLRDDLFQRYVDVVVTGQPFRHEWHSSDDDRSFEIRAMRVGAVQDVDLLVIFRETTDRRRVRGLLSDLSERQRMLERQALQDPLTGVGNRLLIDSRLDHALSRLDRRPGLVAVMFIDLDGLKQINDRYGHRAGDGLLVEVAQRLTRSARISDTVGRLGGDEFVVVCEDVTDPDDAFHIARRLLDALSAPVTVGDVETSATASLGIAIASKSSESPDDLIAAADTAMYRAKAEGGGRVQFADHEISRRVSAHLVRDHATARAIESGVLELWFEPILRAADLSVAAAEVHVRTPRAAIDGDPIGTSPFLTDVLLDPNTNEALAHSISEYAVGEAIRQAARWSDLVPERPLAVVVGVQRSQLADREFPDRVLSLLDEQRLDPRRLCLAIDETIFAESAFVFANGCLERLSDAGVLLERCRVGTRSSAAQYATRNPIRYVKFDTALIDALGRGGDDVLSAAHAICRTRDLVVVSAGIDRSEQLSAVATMGTRLVQGPFFSTPLSVVAFERYVQSTLKEH